LIIIFISCFALCAQSKVLTYKDVISKTYDLSGLAELPEKGEKGALFSSYDRESRYDEKTDSYLRWRANDDGRGCVRKEGNNVTVMADIKGAGVIWRMWSASTGEGKVKIYLDGKLVVDLPWKDYFNRKVAPFNRKGLVYTAAKGFNNYTPISFQKSCKIITEAKTDGNRTNVWGKYFHFNYTIFPEGTKIQTFKMELSPEENKALDKANEIMTAGLGKNPVTYENAKKKILSWKIPAGESKSFVITGRQAITALKVQIPENNNYNILLKRLFLSINWDGEKQPAVWSPIGDFFGTAPGINEYKSLVMGMTEISSQWSVVSGQVNPPLKKGDSKAPSTKNQVPSTNAFEFYSYWYMPFEKSAEITIKNETDKEQQITLVVEHAPLKSSITDFGYFHAKWHHNLETDPKRPLDWLILKTKGRGRFVGFALHIWNPGGWWWGEGDEKFFVDGEKFPSTYGTGSEDYFGYAWCNPTEFSKAFHSQPINPNNKGHISNNRWQIGDNIPFQKSFEADIEKYYKNDRPTLFYCTAYWYLSKNGIDYLNELPTSKVPIKYPVYIAHHVEGAIEFENNKNIKITAGNALVKNMSYSSVRWSGNEDLLWQGAKPGDFLEVEFNYPEEVEKNLIAQIAKNNDMAIIQFYLNGEKAGEEFDCYRPRVTVTHPIDFGKVKLKKGENILKVKIIGANPKAKKLYNVGLDYFKFE
ncbi:MAG: hypothetical protein DRI44_09065, partial [Chlamydiae bacterium]